LRAPLLRYFDIDEDRAVSAVYGKRSSEKFEPALIAPIPARVFNREEIAFAGEDRSHSGSDPCCFTGARAVIVLTDFQIVFPDGRVLPLKAAVPGKLRPDTVDAQDRPVGIEDCCSRRKRIEHRLALAGEQGSRFAIRGQLENSALRLLQLVEQGREFVFRASGRSWRRSDFSIGDRCSLELGHEFPGLTGAGTSYHRITKSPLQHPGNANGGIHPFFTQRHEAADKTRGRPARTSNYLYLLPKINRRINAPLNRLL
jgi:hypothetical protein